LAEGDEVDLGGLTLRAMATPGHTAEHLAYLLADGSRPLGIFTGGSLLAGSAARTDLVGEGRTEELARAQYASLQRLAALPDELVVWPTHGAGTFCAVGAGAAGSATTIGAERSGNRVLGAPDEESFVRLMVDSLGTFPPYFLRLPEQNRRGPAVLPTTLHVPGIAPEAGVLVVDVRPAADFAAGHPEGAISIPLRPAFPTWLAWLAPHDRPLLLLRDEGQDLQEILWLAAKVGYTNILGEVDGGIEAWRRSGLPISTTPLRPAFHSPGVRVLDIRQRSEFDGGHVPGAVNIELGELQDRLVDLPDLPMVVMCGHGERAMGAASILHRAGFTDVTVLDGGPADWLDANPPPGTERP
jgi:rhodanese-related sulfurtransferase